MRADENSVIRALTRHSYFECANFGNAFTALTFV